MFEMPVCIKSMLETIVGLIPILGPPTIGGAVAYLNETNKENFSWRSLVLGMLTAGFVGWICAQVLQTTNLNPNLEVAIVSISGYSSRDAINLFKRRFLKAAEKSVIR